jgi:hypothetical protein
MYHIQQLDTHTLALGGTTSIDLQQLWKRRNGQFCRLAGIVLRTQNQVDQAASVSSIIPGEALATVLSSVSLSSNYEPYGMLLPPMGGTILHNLIGRYLIACGIVLIAGAIATSPSWLPLPLAVAGVQALNFAALEYADRRRHLNRSTRCKH